MAMANPPPQESPLVLDLGSSSDCSLFAPTPIQTPQDFQEPWILQAKDTEEDFDQILPLDGAWDPSQCPRKYRMLAPKPALQNIGHAFRNIQSQDLTAVITYQNVPSATEQSAASIQGPGFVLAEECFHPQRDKSAPEFLIQQPLIPGLGGSAGQGLSSHFCNAQNEKQSMLFAPLHAFTNTPHNFEVNPCPGNYGSLGNDGSASEIKPPSGLPSAHQNDLNTFVDDNISEVANNAFDSRYFAHGSASTQTSTFAMQPEHVSQPFNMLDPQMQRGLDSNGLRFQSAAMPTNQAPNRMPPGLDDQYLSHSDNMWPSSAPTGPANGLIMDDFQPSPFDMQPRQSMRDVAMPSFSLDDDPFFDQSAPHQPWNPNADDMMYTDQTYPDSVYPELYEVNNLAFMPATNADPPADMAPNPTDGTHNPSLPTTPARSNDLGRRDNSRDQQLLDLKKSGLSYKEIKEQYHFPEAESTLRGRYRTLTKTREDRVRKPEWKPDDVSHSFPPVTIRRHCPVRRLHTHPAESPVPRFLFLWLTVAPIDLSPRRRRARGRADQQHHRQVRVGRWHGVPGARLRTQQGQLEEGG